MRRPTSYAILATTATLCAASAAQAWRFDYRFVDPATNQQIGVNGVPVTGTPGVPIRLGIQFGVFNDPTNDAAGGFIGWTVGTISDSGGSHNQRTPGRLPPFNFINGGNGSPASDPFQQLTAIDASLGPQTFVWNNDVDGTPLPMPNSPAILGRETFVSVFELTTTPGLTSYTITAGGVLFAASSWAVFNSVPPDNHGTSDPGDDTPGFVSFAPLPLPPQAFLLPPLVLTIQVPAPTTGVPLAALAAMTLGTRRRRVRMQFPVVGDLHLPACGGPGRSSE